MRGMDRAPTPAWLIALAAAFATVVIVMVVSLVAIVFVNPGGDMYARGRLVGQGLARLSLFVGIATYAGVKLRRRARDRRQR
jgi:hypothetical protein